MENQGNISGKCEVFTKGKQDLTHIWDNFVQASVPFQPRPRVLHGRRMHVKVATMESDAIPHI